MIMDMLLAKVKIIDASLHVKKREMTKVFARVGNPLAKILIAK